MWDGETQKHVRVLPKTICLKDGPVAFSHILQVVGRAKKIEHSGSSWFFSSQLEKRSFAHAAVCEVEAQVIGSLLVYCSEILFWRLVSLHPHFQVV